MKIDNIINVASMKIYEQSTGITQREIERVIRKAISLTLQEIEDGRTTIDEIMKELFPKEKHG